jgi:protein ImuA
VPSGQAPSAVLENLRQKIARIERPSLAPAAARSDRDRHAPWCLGCPAADGLLPPQGLETDSLHEIKAAARGHGASAGDWTAGLGFALRLAALRLQEAQRAGRPAFMLWRWPRVMVQELGRLSGRGLMQLGLDPARVLIVETARESEALMALEEGMKSGTLALALGVFQSASLNAARRLSLAAGEHHTPCLIVTHPAREAAAGCATRWRIGRAPSAPHPFDERACGLPRFSIALERCRARPQSAGLPPLLLEWCDETLRFRMAAELASDASVPRRTRQSA